jgi:hypothetical protein
VSRNVRRMRLKPYQNRLRSKRNNKELKYDTAIAHR